MEKLFTIYEGTEDEKSYTAKDFASMDEKAKINLASNVILEALEDMDPWEAACITGFGRWYQ